MTTPSILILDSVDSTNAEARRRAETGEIGPIWVVARTQTEGRGRRGREWVSERGNLFATLLTTTRKAPAEAAQATFVAALAVADLLEAHFAPLRARRDELAADPAHVEGVLQAGAAKARALARETLKRARKAVGLE